MTATELLLNGLVTTAWVTGLVLLVLRLRGAVARTFGARAAMLLWLLPGLRLVMPALPKKVAPPLTVGDPGPATPVFVPPSAPVEAVTAAPAPLPMEGTAVLHQPSLDLSITGETMAALVLSLWFLGFVFTVATAVFWSMRWRRTLLDEATPATGALRTLTDRVARRAGVSRGFGLVVSGAARTPQLMGLGRPLVVVPAGFEDAYSHEEQEMALLHELTHLKRHDLLVLAASEAAFALQWFNPLVRRARAALRADQEAACDEAVRDKGVPKASYAALLVKAARSGEPVPALTLDHSLKERIIRMQNPLSTPLRRLAFALLAGVSAAAVSGFTAARIEVEAQEEKLVDLDDLSPELRAAIEAEQGERSEAEGLVAALRAEEDEGGDAAETVVLSLRNGNAVAIRVGEDGRVLNEDELNVFADRQGLGLNVDNQGGTAVIRLRGEHDERYDVRVKRGSLSFSSSDDNVSVRVPGAPDAPEPPKVRRRLHGGDVKGLREGRFIQRDGNETVIFLGNPFDGIGEAPAQVDDLPEISFEAPRIERRETEEGTWILVPDMSKNKAFEERMAAFEAKMEAFGDAMSEWGEKMGAAGETFGELIDRCEDHLEDSDEPALLSARVEGTGQTVRALCAGGGRDRLTSAEMGRFLRAEGASEEEMRAWRRARRNG